QFLSSLRRYLSNPLEFQVLVVAEAKKDPIALIVYSIKAQDRVEIPLFRVRKHSLSRTIASHLVLNAISYANQNDAQLIRVTEMYLESEIVDALRAHYFVQINQQWTKISLQIFATVSEVLSYLSGLRTKYQDESEYLFESQNSLDRAFSCNETGNLFEFEKIFWPIKLLDANIPTFVVAIQPYWAMNLFDEPLGKQDIFGSKPELAFNRENVYYRSAHQKILTSPGRVLWYVTGGKGYQNIMSLRACSHLDQVTIGTPKELFRQFKRLGIYQFSDLLKITKNDLTQNIMAFRFSGTQLFARPIQWEKLKKILDRDGPIQSPLRIDQETFANIYQTAFNGEA
ncbi:MAG TPA: hypothetical protein PK530_05310, partial [Anaerolineales bacterium]|nr:hypothetical protein [Anaerolineales bacterium]